MTKTEKEKQIKELEEKQAELQKLIDELKQVKIEEQKEKWIPEIEDLYYCICDGGTIIEDVWEDCITDNWRYLNGNIFKTEQEAEEHKKKIEIQARFKDFVEERTKELNWKNNNQNKYYLYYDYDFKKIIIDFMWSVKPQGVIFASNMKILEDAIAEIGEENVKKYVLEVEE